MIARKLCTIPTKGDSMFASFKYESIPLENIVLDDKNPRIVTQKKLTTQEEILSYLFEHEGLEAFIKKIAHEGKNIGAERPYIVKTGTHYTVVEGNTRIAAYKVLTGLLKAPASVSVPHIPESMKALLSSIECSIAPNRETLLPIMASAHFGLGDKSKWGYLGSRKAVYDEWKAGASIPKLAGVFRLTQGDIRELILEYLLYLKAINLSWSKKEREALLNPAVAFNPPVRFLQTSGHKEKVGVSYDPTNMKVNFAGPESLRRFKHLVHRLVIAPKKGLGATASYEDVFADYVSPGTGRGKGAKASADGKKTSSVAGSKASKSHPPKAGALFSYTASMNNALVKQLMVEAARINAKKLPAAATFLLRNIVEAILKEIIHKQNANASGKVLDLEGAINLCLSAAVTLNNTDKKVLKEFLKHHVNYLNLWAHANVIPNADRVGSARDAIDQFVKKHV
jgi:hypothetical protein